MKDTLLFLLSSIVDHPEDITIEEQTDDARSIFKIGANPQDIGKIIGRGGRIIRAIRDLVKLIATKHGIYADVELIEKESTNLPM